MGDKVKVAVRVRPLNARELHLSAKCVVEMKRDQTILYDPRYANNSPNDGHSLDKKHQKNFAFDHCFWSCRKDDPHFADQDDVFEAVGRGVLENAFQGYNACIFAYGQTGSGKSYTMMGTNDQPGVIPRLCRSLFHQIETDPSSTTSYKVEVSYMEIYNEKVYDLLNPRGTKQSLRVREHSILGPYVDGLTVEAVESFEDIEILMADGNRVRTVAATNMNSESSRSHAVFTILLTQVVEDLASGVRGEKVSKMSLVDLAGSERAAKTGAEGDRLKEGSNINKSLTTLGLVISSLADQSSGKTKGVFVPYRDSILTWLLKDNLGGNSRTVMIATISAAADEYEETLSTLHYANRTKRIVNHAVVNEDPNAKIIRELREEVEILRKQLLSHKGKDIEARYAESKTILENIQKPWEVKLKETELIQEERQQALEKMGLEVHSSGIKVNQGRHYLVNLNDDPSLNENLVYYLKEYNSVGRSDTEEQQDIQLSGIGIKSQHALLLVEGQELFVEPIDDAKTCVNGMEISSRTKLYNRDRLVFGNHHFFRVNCPKSNDNTGWTPEEPVNYESAMEELCRNKVSSDPATASLITALEGRYQEDKQRALFAQSQEYERKMQLYRSTHSIAGTPSTPSVGVNPLAFGSSVDIHRSSRYSYSSTPLAGTPRFEAWTEEREEWFNKCLAQLKTEIIRANTYAHEARCLAKELGKDTDYQVTLQIPVSNLSPNRKSLGTLSEAAIVVKRKHLPNQTWSIEKLQNKLIDMRELYTLWKGPEVPTEEQLYTAMDIDPFYEHEVNHNLIGVANIFMSALFHDVPLEYSVPIVSQQGEIVGRLHVEIARTKGNLSSEDREGDAGVDSENDEDNFSDQFSYNPDNYDNGFANEAECNRNEVVCRIVIKEATGIPPAFANFVFCEYTFWGEKQPNVVPYKNFRSHVVRGKDGARFRFDYWKEHHAQLNEDFLDFCQDGSLMIQVWGHKHAGLDKEWDVNKLDFKSKTIADHWSEVSRKLDMVVEVHELNDQGAYAPVDVVPDARVLTGGVYQLRQGQQRHIRVKVTPSPKGGFLPVNVDSIVSCAIGSIEERDLAQQRGLDSYQEEDLKTLRSKWEAVLRKRRVHLEKELEKLAEKTSKTEAEVERERNLHDQLLTWSEELSSVHVPTADSGIPGAPAQGAPPDGVEMHLPVLYMDLQPDDVRTYTPLSGQYLVVGAATELPREKNLSMIDLPSIRTDNEKAEGTFSWDSSRHDSPALNCVTQQDRFVYLVVRAIVRLTHPAPVDLFLRKRLCISIVRKRNSMIYSVFQKLSGRAKSLQHTGVTYQVVSSLPKASEETEDRTQLALLAAASDSSTLNGESYIDLYLRNVLSVEILLKHERDRQALKIKELEVQAGKRLRKTTSVPMGIGQHFSRSSEIVSNARDRQSVDAASSQVDLSSNVNGDKRASLRTPSSSHEIYTPTPSKFGHASRMLPVVEDQHGEHQADEKVPHCISEVQYDSSHSLHSHASGEPLEGLESPFVKPDMQNSASLSALSSGIGSQTNTQSSLSDASSGRSSNVSPELDSKFPDQKHGEAELVVREVPFDDVTDIELLQTTNVEDHDSVEEQVLASAPEASSVIKKPFEELKQNDEENFDPRTSIYSLDSSDGASFQSSLSGDCCPSPAIGSRVTLLRNGSPGTIRYCGETVFGPGTWAGVELDGPFGKHDGCANDRRYFSCPDRHGLFVRPAQIAPLANLTSTMDRKQKATPSTPSEKPSSLFPKENGNSKATRHSVPSTASRASTVKETLTPASIKAAPASHAKRRKSKK
ncbi:hypothetical protein RvY_14545-2 [Ramazzottius varieornatus]|uniref:Kinesin motor domain-containing protein n=1 Tax=Ramazzottius varieornatus TaxID=947166 RepID=A0A1D1VRQ2_RAMVA|nr:hypothetical protein RvY_14545-2 [Ramazzottius varieornatus]